MTNFFIINLYWPLLCESWPYVSAISNRKETKVEPKKDSNKKSNEEEERNFRAMTLVPCTLGSNMNRQRAGSSAIPGQCTYDDYVVYA